MHGANNNQILTRRGYSLHYIVGKGPLNKQREINLIAFSGYVPEDRRGL